MAEAKTDGRKKRKYTRRTDEERIAELESRIHEIKERLEAKKRRDSPVLREVPKVQRVLRKFAQLALDHGREDLSNSTTAFDAGLERAADATVEDSPRRRSRAKSD